MTQTNETNSRIARLEALMLEVAASNLRHERTSNDQTQRSDRHEQEMADIRAMQRLNQEAIANLTASMQELRNLVADYLRGRSN
jgi:hypothetical protein